MKTRWLLKAMDKTQYGLFHCSPFLTVFLTLLLTSQVPCPTDLSAFLTKSQLLVLLLLSSLLPINSLSCIFFVQQVPISLAVPKMLGEKQHHTHALPLYLTDNSAHSQQAARPREQAASNLLKKYKEQKNKSKLSTQFNCLIS